MRHCRVPPKQVCLLPNVRGVRAGGLTLRPQSKAESRERSRNLQGDFSGRGSQTIRDVPVANFYPQEVLSAPPVPVARVRPVVPVETVRPVLRVVPPVARPTVSLPVVRPAPKRADVLPPYTGTLRKPPPTIVAVPRPAPPPDRPRRTGMGRPRTGQREME